MELGPHDGRFQYDGCRCLNRFTMLVGGFCLPYVWRDRYPYLNVVVRSYLRGFTMLLQHVLRLLVREGRKEDRGED